MKTNYFRMNRISILFSLSVLLFFSNTSYAQLKVASNGNVGAGTISTSPYKLYVKGPNNSNQLLQLEREGDANCTIDFKSSLGLTAIDGGGINGRLTFYTAGSEKVRITPAGNVGIGTTSPAAMLDVHKSLTSSLLNDGIRVNRPDAYGQYAFMSYGNNSSIAYFGSVYTGGGYGQIHFRQYGQSGAFRDAMRIYSTGNVAVGTTPDATGITYKFSVTGDTWCSNGAWANSDLRFKKNIQQIENALEKIILLNGKKYEFRVDEFNDLGFTEGTKIGFIAQELKEVLPEAVKADSGGYYAVNYDAIIPVLVEAIKEQNKKINSLDSINKDLQTLISNCCINIQGMKTINNSDDTHGAGNSIGTGIIDNNLGTTPTSAAVLYQNTPNPFNDQTSIKYFIPSTAQSASIILFDLQGKLVKTFPVSTFENGAITINGYELNAGMFVYSLIVDGKIVDTKNMILTQ